MRDEIEAFGRKWKRVWQEDDATRNDPTAEHLRQAWKRLFGEEYPGSKTAPEEDHGDTFYYEFGDRVYVMAYDGDSIYVPAEAEALPADCAACPERGDFETLCCKGPNGVIEYVPPVDPYTTMVREFHQRMGLVVRDAPGLGTPAEREERVRLMLEELLEAARALGVSIHSESGDEIDSVHHLTFTADGTEPDISTALHELADLQVTVSGTAVQLGLPLLAAAREVHAANMRKTPQGPGRKPLKPEGWKPADVSRVLAGSGGGES